MFNELQKKSQMLADQIEAATNRQDVNETIKLKKQFHQCKLEMLELIDQEENINSISARELIKRVDSMPDIPRYEVGIDKLDMELANDDDRYMGRKGGIEIGTMVQFAGESGAGKTTIVLDILSNVSKYSKTILFSFEMGDRRIVSRLKKKLTTQNQLDNFTIDSHTTDIDKLLIEITIHAREGVKFFAIDSMMKINVKENITDIQKISYISGKLSKLAQDKGIIIILINQMSEEAIKDKRLILKGGNSQQYDADLIFFYLLDKDNHKKRHLVCKKNRMDNHTFTVELMLDSSGNTCGYSEYSANKIEYVHEEKIDSGFVL